MASDASAAAGRHTTGLRRFVDVVQQRRWVDGGVTLPDIEERSESLELRFKYADRYEKVLRRPYAADVLDIVGLYGRHCIPVPRLTERHYWSISCLPSSSDKPLVRVNASWMELFTVYADGDGIRARFLVHLSDFAAEQATAMGGVDLGFLEDCATALEDIGCFFPRGRDIFGITVRGAASIRAALAAPRMLRAVRTFNLTHMNRGRNAYQASHCYSLADHMLPD